MKECQSIGCLERNHPDEKIRFFRDQQLLAGSEERGRLTRALELAVLWDVGAI